MTDFDPLLDPPDHRPPATGCLPALLRLAGALVLALLALEGRS